MTAHRALSKNNKAARKNIGAFDGDGDRCRHVISTDVIVRSHHNGFATMHIHRVVRHVSRKFRAVVFQYGGWDCWLFALIDCTCGNRHRRIHDVGVPCDTSERFSDTFELGNRHIKLSSELCVRTCRIRRSLAATGTG